MSRSVEGAATRPAVELLTDIGGFMLSLRIDPNTVTLTHRRFLAELAQSHPETALEFILFLAARSYAQHYGLPAVPFATIHRVARADVGEEEFRRIFANILDLLRCARAWGLWPRLPQTS